MIVTSQLDRAQAQYSFDVPAGEPWIHEVKKGQTLRIVDLEGNQAVDTLFYNAHNYADRYSAIDTMQRQKNIYLTAGTQLISSEGNVLGEIVADTCRTPRYSRWRLRDGEQYGDGYAIEKRHMHACRQSFAEGDVELGSRTRKTRHSAERELLYERAGNGRGQADV